MTNKDNGGPAFPCEFGGTYQNRTSEGISIRDYFAAKAMQGMIASYGYLRSEVDVIAGSAYDCADAMLKERDK